MRLCVLLVWLSLVYSFSLASTPSKTKRAVKKKKKDETTTDASLAKSVESAANCSSLHNYNTKELRDHILEEWGGKTDEVQAYFDQLPSEEFKENSEDLKFKLYYERKGVRDIDTNQIFNITPGPFRHPPEPVYTIEVNDSYVPKYRITTSEEKRMDEEGTFHSKPTTVEDFEDTSEDTTADHSASSGPNRGKSSSNDGTKGEKRWPPNMDPKERPKKKKKKKKIEKTSKKNELLNKRNNFIRMNLQTNKNTNMGVAKTNTKQDKSRSGARRNIKSQQIQDNNNHMNQLKNTIREPLQMNQEKPQKKQKNLSIYNNFMETSKLKAKNEERPSKVIRPRTRTRQSKPEYQGVRPYL